VAETEAAVTVVADNVETVVLAPKVASTVTAPVLLLMEMS
jgi:hypothetical protein